MAYKKCKNGHLYDSSIYGNNCPFCWRVFSSPILPTNNIIDIMVELGVLTGKLDLIKDVDFRAERHVYLGMICPVGHRCNIDRYNTATPPNYYEVTNQIMLNDCPICENTMRIKQWICSIDGGEEIFMKFFDKSRYAYNNNTVIKTYKI